MEAEQILEVMDFCWFRHQILFGNKHDEFPFRAAARKMDKSGEKSNLEIRSHSDRCIAVDFEAYSPTSVITKPKIPSGEERREKARVIKNRRRRERGRSGMSRSLSALEFEELKGFMDLGFVFDEGETNPNLASIVPALQKWRKTARDDEDEVEVEKKGRVCRPYLSEAWGDDLSMRRGDDGVNILMNLRIAAVSKNEIHIKDRLKVWAHVVASTVR